MSKISHIIKYFYQSLMQHNVVVSTEAIHNKQFQINVLKFVLKARFYYKH